MWWASTDVTTVVGSGVIGKYFTANHYDYALLYTWNYITENGTNRIGIICPEGWRLPTVNEFIALLKASGFTGVNQSTSAGYHANINGTGKNGRWFGPGVATGGSNANTYKYTTDTHLFFPFVGYGYAGVNNATSNNQVGTFGSYCSSTPNGSSNACTLSLWYQHFSLQHYYPRTHAYGIRCVADAL